MNWFYDNFLDIAVGAVVDYNVQGGIRQNFKKNNGQINFYASGGNMQNLLEVGPKSQILKFVIYVTWNVNL